MKRCPYCGKENANENTTCYSCGENLDDFRFDTEEETVEAEPVDKGSDPTIRCPACGSADVQFVTIESGSDFSNEHACCGFLLFGPLGILCGLAGDRKQKTVRKCLNCGTEF
ncbi:MAG: zinc ribbon domain-containing protein [Acholeplasmataceae bacterium]